MWPRSCPRAGWGYCDVRGLQPFYNTQRSVAKEKPYTRGSHGDKCHLVMPLGSGVQKQTPS